ncbi:heavy metal-associated isoprenylated plant protein 20-like [Nicotiana tabacum]|uniref:Heavy metal-associated isoprenylated plant protein 20-like n=3 Tax=Nicotiana tabacum TaxID=4097 RepID=A0AC58U568_TOBAC|nr:heavy metal-associated isoprenylated plant protein 20 [Nicotiana tomentosiformis]XP_016509287.1 PREDICTED: heavy metal-associated isoprenylated plant protein 20-like isoform X1 [Nicotiana tabacum]
MGFMYHISEICEVSSKRKSKKHKTMQTVEIKVKMDCDGCERKVRNAVSSIKGVKSVEINRKDSRVTVTGYVEKSKVLKKVQKTGKKAEIWPYIKYNLVSNPYAVGVYDKKAPSGYVKIDPQALQIPNTPSEIFTSMFSDENPNACSIM